MNSEPRSTKRATIDCNLVSIHALHILQKKLPELEQLEASAVRHGYYPDGTLLIEGPDVFKSLWELLPKRHLLVDGGVWQPNGFVGIEPLSAKSYTLWYTSDYRESLGELDFGIAFPSMWSCPTKDYQLGNFLISVAFKRVPTAEVRAQFALSLTRWFQSVSREGMFGEGPIKPASTELEFRGRLVQFRIDASRSGQDTLNWLLLFALNFGYEVSLVTNFIFDHEKKLQTFLEFPIRTTVESIPLKMS